MRRRSRRENATTNQLLQILAGPFSPLPAAHISSEGDRGAGWQTWSAGDA